MPAQSYTALGLMSGSSLDGLDIACCRFHFDQGQFSWDLLAAETFPFSEMWKARLLHLPDQDALSYARTHVYLGYYLGELCQSFLKKHPYAPDFIASHGHTVFHDPNRRFTAQIGDGAAIAATTGITTIDNFRNQDIALEGEGAPLAPLADQYLLPGFDFYLNLGGIANVSAWTDKGFVAFDISGANQVLNRLSQEMELPFDYDGQIAASGNLIPDLFEQANQPEYLKADYPKSLSNQWVQEQLVQLFLKHTGAIKDRLHTMVHHIGHQIKLSVDRVVEKEKLNKETYSMIVTGGGAFNSFLIKTIQAYLPHVKLEVPKKEIIEFKEAALMALMGALRMEGKANTLHTVTGAQKPTISGAVHLPPSVL